MTLKCLIVDDEPIARQIVEGYCSHLPDLEVVGQCSDAIQARQMLSKEKIDLIFLDINMPVLDGLALVKALKHQPQIIFTTAYKEHAHEAFNLSACDYLLKPFSFDRFLQAVDKAKAQLERSQPEVMIAPGALSDSLFIKSDGKIHKFNAADVLYAEAQGNNVKIVTIDGIVSTTITFSAFEEQLPKDIFVRVHRSFIVNKNKIKVIEGNRIFIGSIEVPIGLNYRDQFLRTLGIK
jgi:DNA-binding LytR/AlgR family response regulator